MLGLRRAYVHRLYPRLNENEIIIEKGRTARPALLLYHAMKSARAYRPRIVIALLRMRQVPRLVIASLAEQGVAISQHQPEHRKASGGFVTACLRLPRRACALLAMTREESTPKFVIARPQRGRGNLSSTRPDHKALPANTVTLRGGASRTPPPTRRVRAAFMPPNLQPARRSLSAATDAIGLYVFIDSLFISAALRRARLSAPLQRIIGGLAHPPH